MQPIEQNKMGVRPVKPLLLTMAAPMVLSMLVQALYNVVDSIFVAKVSQDALTALSLAFPIQSLMIAVSVGTGVGANAFLSRNLGERRQDRVNLGAGNTIFLAVVSYAIFALFGLFFAERFFAGQTDIPAIVHYGTSYLRICTVFSLGLFMQVALERLVQSTGKTIFNMAMQGAGAIVNIILDPIFIFGLFGVPRMEAAGAAIATVTGQFVAMFLGVYFNLRHNPEIQLHWKNLRPNPSTIGAIYRVGFPSIVMQSITSILTFGLNAILMPVEATAVTVFGVYFKLQSFIFMPVFGLTNAMVPIVAYNFGARNKQRIMEVIRFAVCIAVGFMAIGLALFWLIPDRLLMLFEASPKMLEIGVPALRSISLSFIFAGLSIVLVSTFQALGNGIFSLIISLVRQLVVILPVAWLLLQLFGLNAVWYAFPLSEVVAVGLCILFARRIHRTVLVPMETAQELPAGA